MRGPARFDRGYEGPLAPPSNRIKRGNRNRENGLNVFRRTAEIFFPILFVLLTFCPGIRSSDEPGRPQSNAHPVSNTGVRITDIPIKDLDSDGMRAFLGRNRSRGRPLMIFLFYSACRPCLDKLAAIQQVSDDFGRKGREVALDVALVSIRPMDDEVRLAGCIRKSNTHLPVYLLSELNDDIAEEFFLPDWEAVVPSVFFYDQKGRLASSVTDANEINYQALHRRAKKFLGMVRVRHSKVY